MTSAISKNKRLQRPFQVQTLSDVERYPADDISENNDKGIKDIISAKPG